MPGVSPAMWSAHVKWMAHRGRVFCLFITFVERKRIAVNNRSTLEMYPLVKVAAMLVVGIAAGEWWADTVSVGTWLSAAAALSVLSLATRRLPIISAALLGLAVLSAGGALVAHSEERLRIPIPAATTYEAVVMSEPVEHGKVVQMDVGVLTDGRPLMVRASLLRDTVTNRYRLLHVGDGIRFSSVLEKPSVAPDTRFDYALWLHRNGFVATTFIYYKNWERKPVGLSSFSLLQRATLRLRRLRQAMEQQLRQTGLEGEDLSVVLAMALGDRRRVSTQLKTDYSVSGASHVLALSGLHLSIIYGFLAFFLSGLKWLIPVRSSVRRSVSGFLLMTAVWSYVFLAGFSLSAVRSAIMLTVCSVVGMLRRDRFSVNTLAFAALLILSVSPLALFDVGFQLSFMSVLSILLFVPLLEGALPVVWRQRHGAARWLWGMLSVSLSAQIGVAPLVAYYFGRYACYGLLSSFVAIPCAMLILYGVLFFFVCSPVPPLAAGIARGVAAVSGFMNRAIAWIADLPGASWELHHISLVQVVGCYLILFLVWLLVSFFMERIELR